MGLTVPLLRARSTHLYLNTFICFVSLACEVIQSVEFLMSGSRVVTCLYGQLLPLMALHCLLEKHLQMTLKPKTIPRILTSCLGSFITTPKTCIDSSYLFSSFYYISSFYKWYIQDFYTKSKFKACVLHHHTPPSTITHYHYELRLFILLLSRYCFTFLQKRFQ